MAIVGKPPARPYKDSTVSAVSAMPHLESARAWNYSVRVAWLTAQSIT